jgi:type VI protein secretion system component VasK
MPNGLLLPASPAAVRDSASESWITGQGAARLNEVEQRALVNSVIALFAADYIKAWDDLLQDVEVHRCTADRRLSSCSMLPNRR